MGLSVEWTTLKITRPKLPRIERLHKLIELAQKRKKYVLANSLIQQMLKEAEKP